MASPLAFRRRLNRAAGSRQMAATGYIASLSVVDHLTETRPLGCGNDDVSAPLGFGRGPLEACAAVERRYLMPRVFGN